VLPAWRGRKVADIARREIIDLVESVAADTPYAGNRLLAALSKFFSWLVARDVIAMSPAAGVERPHREVARERVLDDDELRRLWRACEDEGPFGAALRLMILTGTRRNEVSAMPWEELHENRQLWLLPAERTKNDRPHAIPLPTQARAIIESRPQINGSAFVFTIDGRRPIVGWAKVKREISIKAGLNPKSWRLHDLRRTCASGMQRLGTPVPVVEKALNHVSGTFRGIVATYQRHTYAKEIRVALQAWADHVEELVSGRKSSKVVRIRKMK
jgi:integrase